MANPNEAQEDMSDVISMRRSLTRVQLFLGGEPMIMAFLVAMAAIFLLIFQKQLSIAMAVLLIVVGIPAARKLAKYDPYWSTVLTRAFVSKAYYPANSYINVKTPAFRKQQRIKRST